jgi:hypothetical protein
MNTGQNASPLPHPLQLEIVFLLGLQSAAASVAALNGMNHDAIPGASCLPDATVTSVAAAAATSVLPLLLLTSLLARCCCCFAVAGGGGIVYMSVDRRWKAQRQLQLQEVTPLTGNPPSTSPKDIMHKVK